MKNKYTITISIILIFFFSALSIIANYPKIFSPYSMPSVFAGYVLGDSINLRKIEIFLPGIIFSTLFLILIKDNVFGKIGLVYRHIFLILILLSAILNVLSIPYGIEYQGVSHTVTIVSLNLIFGIIFSFMCFKKKIYEKYYVIYISSFLIWFSYSSFPWLGELI